MFNLQQAPTEKCYSKDCNLDRRVKLKARFWLTGVLPDRFDMLPNMLQ